MKINPDDLTQSHQYKDHVTGLDLWSRGLSKREYFAACAMQGFLSCDSAVANMADYTSSAFTAAEVLSNCSVIAADELIKALNRERVK